MSLFKLREFWTTNVEDDESFDQSSLIVTNLNTSSDFIISGSHSGVLRIFKPSCYSSEKDYLTGFVPTDLIIEQVLSSPILQLEHGRLASGSQNVHLTVLHPRSLSVYSLRVKEGVTDHDTQYYLDLLYEHHLQRLAANFVVGPFGSCQNRDFICVQSLDGMLSIFEQESATFNCFLPDFLLAGPLAYTKKNDAFVTSNNNWSIVTYKYNQLSEIGEKSGESNDSFIAKVTNDWSYNIGEMIIDISVTENCVSKECWIIVLGERNLFCLNDRGKLKFMKRLDYFPVGFHTYLVDENIFSLVISETSTLLIYENTTLKWSAKLQFLPICIKRIFLENIKGALVLLSEEGRLECGYLGTEPSLFVAPPLVQKEIDFEKVEEELEHLNRVLRSSYNDKLSNIIEKDLAINVTVQSNLEPCVHETNLRDTNVQMCTIIVELIPQVLFDEVQITLTACLPLKISPAIQHFSNFSEKTSFVCHAYLSDEFLVPSMNVELVATLVTSLGVPKCMNKSVMVPLPLLLDVCQPQKEGEHKITLNINENPVPLAALFPDFGDNPLLTQSANAIGLKYHSDFGETVTILLAKNSKRYRLQSNCVACLSLIVEQMIFRLKRHYMNTDNFKVFYNSMLPSESIVPYIYNHFKVRQEVLKLEADLTQLSAQFRIIQKRLIAKLKAKNPSLFTNLEILLHDTYSDIIQVTENLDRTIFEHAKAETQVSCALNLLQNLIQIMEIDRGTKEILNSVFCNSVYNVESQNWEDVIDSSLCYLLRTILAKSDKDRLRVAPTSFEEIKDVSKVEKHFTQVLDRISKKEKNEHDEDEDEENNSEEENVDNKENEKPIGSQFGEASSRLLSARKSLLRRKQSVDV